MKHIILGKIFVLICIGLITTGVATNSYLRYEVSEGVPEALDGLRDEMIPEVVEINKKYSVPDTLIMTHEIADEEFPKIINGTTTAQTIGGSLDALAGMVGMAAARNMFFNDPLWSTNTGGMFPIDSKTNDYDKRMIELFNERLKVDNISWKLQDILPKVLVAGDAAGVLSEDGAKLLDPNGQLRAGIPLCPPEGDAGTGMVATNSIAERTGNVSAGTSVFAMIVLEKDLSKVYHEIDMVTTPTGKPVARHVSTRFGVIQSAPT